MDASAFIRWLQNLLSPATAKNTAVPMPAFHTVDLNVPQGMAINLRVEFAAANFKQVIYSQVAGLYEVVNGDELELSFADSNKPDWGMALVTCESITVKFSNGSKGEISWGDRGTSIKNANNIDIRGPVLAQYRASAEVGQLISDAINITLQLHPATKLNIYGSIHGQIVVIYHKGKS